MLLFFLVWLHGMGCMCMCMCMFTQCMFGPYGSWSHARAGDTIYIGRYLVSGTDSASLFLEVQEVNGTLNTHALINYALSLSLM